MLKFLHFYCIFWFYLVCPNESWGLSEIPDSDLGQQIAEGWQKADYIDCLNRFGVIGARPLDSPDFEIAFGLVEGEDCNLEIMKTKNASYSLNGKKLKFGFSIIPKVVGPKYTIKTVLYLRSKVKGLERIVWENSGSCNGPTFSIAELSDHYFHGKYRMELFINNNLLSVGNFEIQ